MTLLTGLQIIAMIVWGFYEWKILTKSIHMLQLNAYTNSWLWKWYVQHFRRMFSFFLVLPIVALYFYFSQDLYISYSAWIASYLLLIVTFPKEVEKKRLVYTPRVIRLLVTTTLLFAVAIALLLMLTDVTLPALYVISLLPIVVTIIVNTINKPIELMVNQYYINDAKKILNNIPHIEVIGITGSFGKTSVKHFLHTILAQSFNVLMTPESYNTPMGVTKTIRTYMSPVQQYFICEMGAKKKGEIQEICDIVHPKYGIITSIAEQHLETFKSLERIKQTKFELAESLPSDGVVFLNMDDENIASQLQKANLRCKVVTYGINSENTDYRAVNIQVSRNGCTFTVRRYDGVEQQFETALLGEHNVHNLLACIAVADTFGVPLQKIAAQLKKVKPVKHRLELKKNGNITILDDSFNSNPVGSKAALKVLSQMPGRKILVTPGMIELGEKEYEYNYSFAEAAAKVCDYIILVGPKQTKPMQDALRDHNYKQVYVAKNLQEGLHYLQTISQEGDVVLLENDLPDSYNE